MPMPPASCTARLLLTRSLVPRSHSTILPATLAGSSTGVPPFHEVEKHNAAAEALAPGRAAAVESMKGAGPAEAAASEMPLTVLPLPSVTEPTEVRLCVPAATVVSHGPGCATVLAVGPLLPADAATNTPASAAYMKAISTGSRKF